MRQVQLKFKLNDKVFFLDRKKPVSAIICSITYQEYMRRGKKIIEKYYALKFLNKLGLWDRIFKTENQISRMRGGVNLKE